MNLRPRFEKSFGLCQSLRCSDIAAQSEHIALFAEMKYLMACTKRVYCCMRQRTIRRFGPNLRNPVCPDVQNVTMTFL